jgi:hypothetical protein
MSQELMPVELRYLSDLPALPPTVCVAPDPDLVPLRRQVMGIIWSILEDPAPEGACIRTRLRECLAQNAGRPEKALLDHLLALHGRHEDPQPELPSG